MVDVASLQVKGVGRQRLGRRATSLRYFRPGQEEDADLVGGDMSFATFTEGRCLSWSWHRDKEEQSHWIDKVGSGVAGPRLERFHSNRHVVEHLNPSLPVPGWTDASSWFIL